MLYVIKNEYIIYSNIFTLFEGLKCLYTHYNSTHHYTINKKSCVFVNYESWTQKYYQPSTHQPPCSTTTVTTQTAMAHPRFDYSSPKRLRVDSPQSIGQSPSMLPATKGGRIPAQYFLPSQTCPTACRWLEGAGSQVQITCGIPNCFTCFTVSVFQITDTSNVVRFNINPANFSWATRQKSSTIPWSVHFDWWWTAGQLHFKNTMFTVSQDSNGVHIW